MGGASKAQLMKTRVAPPGARGTGPRLRLSGYLTGIGVAELLAGELARIAGVMTLLRVGGPCSSAGHQGCTEKSENDLTHGFLLFYYLKDVRLEARVGSAIKITTSSH
jgi:hypothetical protein